MRERYIKMRQEGVIDTSLMYEYFMSKNPKISLSFEDFIQILRAYVHMVGDEIFNKMDLEFEVVTCIFEESKIMNVKNPPKIFNYL